MASRLKEWTKRVTREMLAAWAGNGTIAKAHARATAVLEREARAFVGMAWREVTMNDAVDLARWLDASPAPGPGAEPTPTGMPASSEMGTNAARCSPPRTVPEGGAVKLTFERFSEMNRRRCESYHGFGESLQPESKYTLLAWVASVASEAGEALDAVIGAEGLKARRAGKTKLDIAKELADVITYADLAIQKLGLQTADVLVQKFDEVNARLDEGRRFSLAALPEQREGR